MKRRRIIVSVVLMVLYAAAMTACSIAGSGYLRSENRADMMAAAEPWMPAVRGQDSLGPTPPDIPVSDWENIRGLPRRDDAVAALPRPVAGRLSVSIEEAVMMTLTNNRSLGVRLFAPVIAGTFDEQERAVFDPAVFADVTVSRDKTEQLDRTTGQTGPVRGASETYRVGVGQRLPTGTDIGASLWQSRADSGLPATRHAAGVQLSLTQALLRGAGLEANLARVRQAELDSLASLFEVRGFTEALVAEVETTYWNYVLGQERVKIYEEAYSVAQKQSLDIERRVQVGSIAETELAAAQAELAFRRQGFIDAESLRDRTRLSLLRLLNPDAADGWTLRIEARDVPSGPDVAIDPVGDHAALGLRLRPELAEARLRVERGRLDVVQTRNGLLPRLDLFVTLGKTGYAESFGNASSRVDGPYYEAVAGLRFDWSLGNRAARALMKRAQANRAQAAASLDNLAQLVVKDIHEAYLEVERARAQIQASAARVRLQQEVLRAEQVKFEAGRGTALTVAQAQRDLLESRLAEVNAVIGYRQARISLYRLDGSLLSRRGIDVSPDASSEKAVTAFPEKRVPGR
jgi:outer membrane protein TolC